MGVTGGTQGAGRAGGRACRGLGVRSRIRGHETRPHVQLIVQQIVNNLRDKQVLTRASLPVLAPRPDFPVSGAGPAARHIPAVRAGRVSIGTGV